MPEHRPQWLDAEAWRWTVERTGLDEWLHGRRSSLLLDLRGEQAILEHLPAGNLPCPVVGRVDEQTPAAVRAMLDCWVEDEQGIPAIEESLSKRPLAALALTQLSRALRHLDTGSALDMESLAYAALQAGAEHREWLANRPVQKTTGAVPDSPVILDRSGDTLRITLDAPERRNAMSAALRDALVEALEFAALDDSIDSVILQGNGKCFSVGGDLDEFGSVPDPATGHWIRSVASPARCLAGLRCGTVARLHGACIGAGIEVPAFAGHVTAAPGSYFQLPELSLGLIPGAGGCVSIARRIGRQRFLWMVFSGRRLCATRALDWGLIDAIEAPRRESAAAATPPAGG